MNKPWDLRASECFGHNCTTYSKRSDQFVKGIYPTHITRVMRNRLVDTDDKAYIDFTCGLGSNLIGWQNNFGLPTTLEVEAAELVKSKFKLIERLKFLKTGSEACQAAVRIARAYTNKKVVLGIGYHGWHNIFIAQENPGLGCVNEFYYKTNDLDSLIHRLKQEVAPTQISTDDIKEINFSDIAAVIIEPVMLDLNVKNKLQEIRDLCTKHKIILIFDEVITGCRVPKYCIAQYFDIIPDLIVLGKALSNGYPLGIVGGKKELFEPAYFISSTFAGESSALESLIKTLNWVTPSKLNELWKQGKEFIREMNSYLKAVDLELYGLPTRFTWKGNETNRAIMWQELCKSGILFGKGSWINFQHFGKKNFLTKTLRCTKAIVECFSTYKLEGELPQEVFKRF